MSTGSPAPTFVGATLGIRPLARVIDMIVDAILVEVGMTITSDRWSALEPFAPISAERFWELQERNLLVLGIGMVLPLAMGAVWESMGGSPPGKLVCGLRVISLDGKMPSMKAALIRNLAFL